MLLTLLRRLAIAATCAVVLAGTAFRLQHLQERARADLVPSAAATEDARLFHDLLDAGLLLPTADGTIDRLPEDYALLERIADEQAPFARSAETRRTRRHLLRQLDSSGVGSLVRRELRLWNQTRTVTAVRDDRPRAEGDTSTRWSAFNSRGRPLPPSDLVPESFGFVHGGILRAGFSDWLSAHAGSGPVTFRTEIAGTTARVLTIQVVGELDTQTVPPHADVERRTPPPTSSCAEDSVAYVVRVPIPAGERPTAVTLTVTPTPNCSGNVHGLAIRLVTPEGDAQPRYAWRSIRRAKPASRFVVRTADGIALTSQDGDGSPTRATYDLGLLPIVGTGRGDTLSLSGMLARTPSPPRTVALALTIDSHAQKAAHDALRWGITRLGNDRWAAERKGALVVLDAEDGAILAVAGHPTVPLGVHPWDYAAFSTTYPLRDPATVIAWEVVDKHNTPGSTFKPVTALALMMEQNPSIRETLHSLIRGVDSSGLTSLTGLSRNSSRFLAYKGAKAIPNFGGAPFGRYWSRPQRARACLPATTSSASGRARFGLTEAVQFSLNAWFARLALLMEQAKIDEYAARIENHDGARIPAPELTLTRTARWLGIDDRTRLDLAANVPPTVRLARFASPAVDVLFPQLARSTVAGMAFNKRDLGARRLMMYTTALNGIGQTVSASPLHMALAAATVSSGHRVGPHLLSLWDGRPLPAPPTTPLPVAPELLDHLRSGMKAVVEAGTAARAFPPPLACRVYGKTGTAEIDAARSFNSAWFIGWREPATTAGRRLAIACMVTHATGQFRFGGTACAPVVSRFLEELERDDAHSHAAPAGGNGAGDSAGPSAGDIGG